MADDISNANGVYEQKAKAIKMLLRLTLLFIICGSSNSLTHSTDIVPLSQNVSETFDDWVMEHIRYFDSVNFNHNWTEIIDRQSENTFTVALSVWYWEPWYPTLKFGATFLKAMQSHFGADADIWNYHFE